MEMEDRKDSKDRKSAEKTENTKNAQSGTDAERTGNTDREENRRSAEKKHHTDKEGGVKSQKQQSRSFSFLVAAVLAVLAAIALLAVHPVFEKRVERSSQTQSTLGDGFLLQLYQNNYVLYRDLVNQAEEGVFNYADLYLEVEETDQPVTRPKEAVEDAYEATEIPEDYADYVRWDINERLEEWRNDFLYGGVAENLDYYAVDESTGKTVTNTGRDIAALTLGQNADGKMDLPYVFYVRMSYDGAGNVENVAVKDVNSEELLKRVRKTMQSNYFESCLQYIHPLNSNHTDILADTDENGREVHTMYRTKSPENVTFIYAVIQEQMEELLRCGWGSEAGDAGGWYMWYSSGILEVYYILLLILALTSLLFMHHRSYCLPRLKMFRIPVEIGIAGAMLLTVSGGEFVVSLAQSVRGGYWQQAVKGFFPNLPMAVVQPALTAAHFLLLLLLFALWLYFVNALGGVTVIGFWPYLKERSLIIQLWLEVSGFCKRKISRFKEEMLHADLSGEAGKMIWKAVALNFVVLAVMCSLWFFGWIAMIAYSLMIYYLLRKYVSRIQDQYRKLLNATGAIADGNLNTTVEEDLGVFESYKEELVKIQEGFRRAVDEEVKSQRMKAELITNVSHDLKTPLTAITTYIDLLKEENITEEQRKEYIAVLEKKSLRLKSLIEDLFEVSKANSQNVTVNLVDVDILNLMRQVYLEYEESVEDAGLIFRFRTPEEKIILKLDSEKTCRIFENLYTNIIKYAMPNTRVYVDAQKTENGIRIGIKNMSATELLVDPEELTERFVRGDSSRNTEGNGLGLAIARSFTELQGGTMKVEVDGDLFKVTLEW